MKLNPYMYLPLNRSTILIIIESMLVEDIFNLYSKFFICERLSPQVGINFRCFRVSLYFVGFATSLLNLKFLESKLYFVLKGQIG